MSTESKSFYKRMQEVAYRLINKYGTDLIYVQKINKEMDIVTGSYKTTEEVIYPNIKSIIGTQDINESGFGIDSIHPRARTTEETIIDTDTIIIIAALNLVFEPDVKSEIEFDGSRYDISRIKRVPPGGIPIVYHLFVGK